MASKNFNFEGEDALLGLNSFLYKKQVCIVVQTNRTTYKNSLVSVVVPTYNRVDFILKSLDSVYAQTYRPIEVVVVDDGSTDNTQKSVNEWVAQKEDQNFTTQYIYQENGGAPAARNTGIAKASGRYLQFLDSDDLLAPKKLELQVAKLQKEQTSICICGYHHLNEQKKITRTINNNRAIEEILSSPLYLHTSIGIIDKQFLKRYKLRWNLKLKKFQDRDFYHKLFLLVKDHSIVDKPLFDWIRHKGERIFDDTPNTHKIYATSLKSLLWFHFKHRKAIASYKKPYIKKTYKNLFFQTRFGQLLASIAAKIPNKLKIWRYFRK